MKKSFLLKTLIRIFMDDDIWIMPHTHLHTPSPLHTKQIPHWNNPSYNIATVWWHFSLRLVVYISCNDCTVYKQLVKGQYYCRPYFDPQLGHNLSAYINHNCSKKFGNLLSYHPNKVEIWHIFYTRNKHPLFSLLQIPKTHREMHL